MGVEDDPEANIKNNNGLHRDASGPPAKPKWYQFRKNNGNSQSAKTPHRWLWFGTAKTAPMRQNSKAAKNMNANFCEHTWDVDRCEGFFKESNIDVRNPEKTKGLTKSKADELLERNGPNELPKPKEMSDLELFLRQFLNLLWILLFVASTLTLAGFFANTSDLTSLWVTIILYIMIVVMCFISFYQEREARRVVRGFQNLLPEKCTVIRDGRPQEIPASGIVVGDIIKIQNGKRVPADARVLHCSQLKLETSSITGEAEPIDYQTDAVPETTNIFESKNVAFNGSLCVDGEGTGVVIRTGIETVIGQIAELTTGQPNKKSRLEMQIKKFVKFLVFLALSIGTFVFVSGGFVHHWENVPMLLATSFAVCAVGMVPEGLPATVTSILTVIARRLSAKNVYLKRLDIVEALGSANIIASDKTGTLTKNIMTLTDLWYHDEITSGLPGGQEQVTGKSINQDIFKSPLSDLLIAMTVCNKATIMGDTIQKGDTMHNNKDPNLTKTKGWKASNTLTLNSTIQKSLQKALRPFSRFRIKSMKEKQSLGTPSEIAMLKYVEQIIDVRMTRVNHKIVFEIPFNSKRKWHLIIIKGRDLKDGTSKYKLMMKGASEILITKCSKMMTSTGDVIDLDEDAMEKFQKSYDHFGEHGRRVIGFIQHEFVASSNIEYSEKEENFPQDGLTFIGTCAIMDPPRDESAGSIKKCKEAGIKVFMVTGDHHTTAKAIAKQIGLIEDIPGKEKDWDVVHGENISKITDSEWDRLISMNNLVFSRTTPEQKLMIVEQCQKRKQIIAMTGDGVNDAPALKKSDIGVGMGSGSDVAKQAADIILTDDNFSSIVKAIQEGRLMFDNIKKLMAYILTHTFPEIWAVMLNFCFGLPIGTSSLMILSIDLGTEIAPGIAMCKEPMEGDLMKRPPRRRDKVVISWTLLFYSYFYMAHIQVIACFLSYWYVFYSHGISLSDLWMSATNDHWKDDGTGKDFHSNGNNFTGVEQQYIGRQARSAWMVGIVFSQVFHIFSTRTLRQSMFTHGFFRNKASIIAVLCELALLLIFVYVPGINEFLGGAPVPAACWGIVAAISVFIFCFNEVRKFFIRKCPQNRIVRIFKF